jgi:hypothetical protein
MMSKCRNVLFVVMLVGLSACKGQDPAKNAEKEVAFPQSSTQELTYDTASRILQDMSLYNTAVKKLDNASLQRLDKNYQTITFRADQKALFLNVYPDPAGGRVIFLLVPKEPTTFDRKLPVIDSDTVELQIRTRDPEQPLNCTLKVADAAAYMTQYPSHTFEAQYHLKKRFLQSGTYDFDALTIPSYRARGHAFITFDLVKAEVKDETANLIATCAG